MQVRNDIAAYARPVIVVGLLLGGLVPRIGAVPITLLFAIAAAAYVVIDIVRDNGNSRLFSAGAVVFFALMSSHALFVSPDQDYGLNKLASLVTLTLLTALSASLITGEGRFVPFTRVWTFTAAGLGLLATLELFFLGGDDLTGRAEGFAESPIWLARAIMTGAIFCFWLLVKGSISPYIAVPIICLDFIGILSTGSRGPLAGAVIGITIIALFGIKWSKRRLVAASVSLCALTAILVAMAAIYDSRILRLGLGGESDAQRREYWSLSWQSLVRDPFGVGFGRWAEATSPTLGLPLYPHNLFLEAGSELGWFWMIALVAVTAVGVIVAIRNLRHRPESLALIGAFAAETFQVSISGDINARTFFFFAGALLLIGLDHRIFRKIAERLHNRRRQLSRRRSRSARAYANPDDSPAP